MMGALRFLKCSDGVNTATFLEARQQHKGSRIEQQSKQTGTEHQNEWTSVYRKQRKARRQLAGDQWGTPEETVREDAKARVVEDGKPK